MKLILFATLLAVTSASTQLRAAQEAEGARNPASTLAGSSWVGVKVNRAKGNSPAELKISQQNGTLTALLTCDNVAETLTVTLPTPSTLQLKGVSFADLKYSGRTVPLDFSLDSFSAELSQQGQQLSLTGVDSRGSHSRYEFRRASGRY